MKLSASSILPFSVVDFIHKPFVIENFLFYRLTKDMLKIQNKQNEENNLGDEKLPSNYQKRLPVPFTRILDDTVIGNCILPPKLLIWDAFISSLSQFDLLERVAYCSAMGPYIDQIMPHLFSLLSDPHLCKFFQSFFLSFFFFFFFFRKMEDCSAL